MTTSCLQQHNGEWTMNAWSSWSLLVLTPTSLFWSVPVRCKNVKSLQELRNTSRRSVMYHGLSSTKIALQNRSDHGGRRQARNHFATEIARFSASPAAKKSLAASDFGMQPQLAFKIAGKSPVLKGRDFFHPTLPPFYRSQTSYLNYHVFRLIIAFPETNTAILLWNKDGSNPFMTSNFRKGPFRGHLAQWKESILRRGRATLGVFLLTPFLAMFFWLFWNLGLFSGII